MTELQKIDAEILELTRQNKERIEQALKDPSYKNSPEKLHILALEQQNTLAEIFRLQQNRLIILLQGFSHNG